MHIVHHQKTRAHYVIGQIVAIAGISVVISYLMLPYYANEPAQAATVAPHSEVAHWTLDDGAGTKVANSSATGADNDGALLHVTNADSSGWVTNGKLAGAIAFDGVDDAMNFGSDASLDDLLAADATISMWIKPTDCSTRYIGGKTNGGAVGYMLFASGGACNPRIDVHHSGGSAITITAASSLSIGQWSNVVYVWDATAKTARIYVNGTEATIAYRRAPAGSYQSDAGANFVFGNWHQSAGGPFFAGGADDIRVFNYALTSAEIAALPSIQPEPVDASKPLLISHPTATTYLVDLRIAGDSPTVFARYRMADIGGNRYNLRGLRVHDRSGAQEDYVVNANDSCWEYAYRLGVAGDPLLTSNWDFFGCGHGNETSLDFTLKLDGIATTIPVGATLAASSVVFDQQLQTLLPKDHSTVVGATSLRHTFDETQLTIEHTHTFDPGYEIYSAYSAMMPVTNTDGTGMEAIRIGKNPIRTLGFANTVFDLTTVASGAFAFSSKHPYTLRMSLPSGGPDTNGSWAKAQGPERMWLYDTTSGGKVYVNYVSSQYADRVPASASSHKTRYSIERNPAIF